MTPAEPIRPATLPSIARVGRYELELVLGQGTVGRTYMARDPAIGRAVVVKVVRDDLPLSADEHSLLVASVRERARAAGALASPAFATLHDLGVDATVGLYLVYEVLTGRTLRDAIVGGPLSRAEVVALALALGPALAAAHAAGVVHGNVTPDNVVLASALPKLTGAGFGAPGEPALALGEAAAYTAPEVLRGAEPTAASDQFALAATLYEALTARRAFAGNDAETRTQVGGGTLDAAPSARVPELRVYPRLDAIFDRALAKDPRSRFASCEAFASALATALEPVLVSLAPGSDAPSSRTDTPATRSSIVPRSTRRWQNAAAGAGVLVIFGLVLLGREPHGAGVSLKNVAGAFAVTLASGPHPPPARSRPAAPMPGSPASPSRPKSASSGNDAAPTAVGAGEAGLEATGIDE
jgi:serine/threonine-protein kinase